jgi:hypothetical protein
MYQVGSLSNVEEMEFLRTTTTSLYAMKCIVKLIVHGFNNFSENQNAMVVSHCLIL